MTSRAARSRTATLEALAPEVGLHPAAVEAARRRCDALIAQERLAVPAAQVRRRPATGARRLVLLGAAASTLTIAALVMPELPGEAAFASWVARPESLDAEESAAEVATCRDTVDMVVANDGGGIGWPSSVSVVAALEPEVVERRGAYTLTLLGDDHLQTTCVRGAETTTSFSTALEPSSTTFADHGVDVVAYVEAGGAEDDRLTTVQGRVDRDALGVEVTRSDGQVVHATVTNGFYAAWWPGRKDPEATITVQFADGTSTGPLRIDALSPGVIIGD